MGTLDEEISSRNGRRYLEGLHFQNMPVKYLMYVNIILKNNVTIHYDIAKELKIKKQER